MKTLDQLDRDRRSRWARCGGVAPAAAAGAAGDQPHAQLKGYRVPACAGPAGPYGRGQGGDAAAAGTQRLELKFDLLVSHPGSPAAPVRSGDLGVWSEPKNPTLGQLPGDVWNFQKTVVDLDAPATYQFRVSFRWLGAGGKVIGYRGPLQPALSPARAAARPAGDGADRRDRDRRRRPNEDLYTATIRNAGATAAGPFAVAFVPGGSSAAPSPQTIQRLGAGKRAHACRSSGPLCATADPADPPEIIADSAAQVDDLNRANNTLGGARVRRPGGSVRRLATLV